MKKLAVATFVFLAMVAVLGSWAPAEAQTCTCAVCTSGKFLPAMPNFTLHIKATGYPDIGFSYKPALVKTQRMILCVPKTGSPGTLIPTPWITGPKVSMKDIAAVKATYDANKECFYCSEPNKAADGCYGLLWKEVTPTGAAPTFYIKNQ